MKTELIYIINYLVKHINFKGDVILFLPLQVISSFWRQSIEWYYFSSTVVYSTLGQLLENKLYNNVMFFDDWCVRYGFVVYLFRWFTWMMKCRLLYKPEDQFHCSGNSQDFKYSEFLFRYYVSKYHKKCQNQLLNCWHLCNCGSRLFPTLLMCLTNTLNSEKLRMFPVSEFFFFFWKPGLICTTDQDPSIFFLDISLIYDIYITNILLSEKFPALKKTFRVLFSVCILIIFYN